MSDPAAVPGPARCDYCGDVIEGEPRSRRSTDPIVFKTNRFCDDYCYKAFAVSLSAQHFTPDVYYAIPGKLRPVDKFWFIEFPLKMYNMYYNRNVDTAVFIESIAEIVKSTKFWHLSWPAKVAIGYYAAARASCKDYIPHATYMRGFDPSIADRVRKVIVKRVFDLPACNLQDRAVSLLVKGLRRLEADVPGTPEKDAVTSEDAERVVSIFRDVRKLADFHGYPITVAAISCYYILMIIIKKNVSMARVSRAFDTHEKFACKQSGRAIRETILMWKATQTMPG